MASGLKGLNHWLQGLDARDWIPIVRMANERQTTWILPDLEQARNQSAFLLASSNQRFLAWNTAAGDAPTKVWQVTLRDEEGEARDMLRVQIKQGRDKDWDFKANLMQDLLARGQRDPEVRPRPYTPTQRDIDEMKTHATIAVRRIIAEQQLNRPRG